MTIVYCDFTSGNDDTGDGSYGNPYKTITKASTSRTGGDEVRVAKSPAPTALTGTIAFTKNNTAVTGTETKFSTELVIGDFIEGGDGNWWEVITIASDTSATLYKNYSGDTQSGVSSRKLGITNTGVAAASTTEVQKVSSSGTSSATLKISGGWDLATQTQDGQTYFRQMHGTFNNRYGYGLYMSGKSYTEIERLHFLRYNCGIHYANSSNNNTLTSPTCNSNGSYGIYYYASSNNNTCTSPTCNSNGSYGIYYYSSSNNNTLTSPTCNSNTNCGIRYASSNNNTCTSPTCNSNGSYGIYYASSGNNVCFGALTTSGNASGAICNNYGTNYIAKASIAESTIATGFTDLCNARIYINDIGGHSQIWTDSGNIISQDATAGGSGKEWRLNVTADKRGSYYPLALKIAEIAVASGSKVTVKAYVKKSHATGIAGALFMRGGQIAGAGNDIKTDCPNDTNRNQLTIEFTPTEAGVVEIEAWAWYVSSTTANVIVDDIEVTQV